MAGFDFNTNMNTALSSQQSMLNSGNNQSLSDRIRRQDSTGSGDGKNTAKKYGRNAAKTTGIEEGRLTPQQLKKQHEDVEKDYEESHRKLEAAQKKANSTLGSDVGKMLSSLKQRGLISESAARKSGLSK